MAIGYFLDKNHSPSDAEIISAIGDFASTWERMHQFIRDQFAIPGVLHYGGKSYGWHTWYRKSGKALASIYAQKGYFVAQIVLNSEQVERAMRLDLGAIAGQILRETPQLRDGRWLFIPVRTENDEIDIENLLLVKHPPAKRKPAS